MTSLELEDIAAKSFPDFHTYWKTMCAFRDDYLFFGVYMSRNRKSEIDFKPGVYLRSFQSVIDDYPKTEPGLARAFNIFTIVKQIILDLQEWNTPVYEEAERNRILKEIVKYEYVDIDIFCNDFVSSSSMRSEIRAKIDEIINSDAEVVDND